MYIKRNVYFSAVDQETGEEKLFSTTEIMSEDAYQKEFGEKAKDAAAKASNRISKPIKAVKDYHNNAKGKAEAAAKGAVDKNGKKLTGAAAKAKTEKLLAEAGKVSRNRKIGAGAAVAGTIAAGAGLNVIRKKDKK